MKYIIIKAKSINELESYVNNHIKQEFIPQGGICCDEFQYYQAMIKK